MADTNSAKADAAHWAIWLIAGLALAGLALSLDSGFGRAIATVAGIALLAGLAGMISVLYRISKN